MAKLTVGGATVHVSRVLCAIIMGIGWPFGKDSMGAAVLVCLQLPDLFDFYLCKYIGYLIKAGHIAVIAAAMSTRKIPLNQVEYGKKTLTQRLGTTNVSLLWIS